MRSAITGPGVGRWPCTRTVLASARTWAPALTSTMRKLRSAAASPSAARARTETKPSESFAASCVMPSPVSCFLTCSTRSSSAAGVIWMARVREPGPAALEPLGDGGAGLGGEIGHLELEPLDDERADVQIGEREAPDAPLGLEAERQAPRAGMTALEHAPQGTENGGERARRAGSNRGSDSG